MKILGATIKTDEIIGISALHINMRTNPSEYYVSFSIITKGSSVEFKSAMIEDFHIATASEQKEIAIFREQYRQIKKTVDKLLPDEIEESTEHSSFAFESFEAIVERHRLIENLLRSSKAKFVPSCIKLLNEMKPHIINLKNLAK